MDIEPLWDLHSEEEARGPEAPSRHPRFLRHHGQTNSVLEGTNNKIKLIKLIIHRAYGFHCVAALMAMIHLCCSGLDLS